MEQRTDDALEPQDDHQSGVPEHGVPGQSGAPDPPDESESDSDSDFAESCDLAVVADPSLEISELQFMIIRALINANAPRHGYAIFQNVVRLNHLSRETCIYQRVGQASVYKSVEGLLRRGMLSPGPGSVGPTGRRLRDYVVTDMGLKALAAKTRTMQELLAL